MDACAEDSEENGGEGEGEQAAELAATYELRMKGRFRTGFIGLRDGLRVFCEPGHWWLLRERDVVEESYAQFELRAVELPGKRRELAFAGDGVPCGVVERDIAGAGF